MSSLSETELRKVARELDLEFLSSLRDMLMSLPLRIDDYQEDLNLSRPDADLSTLIYEKSKARRLSKDKLVSYMSEFDQIAAKRSSTETKTLRALIENFVSRVGPGEAASLLRRLSGMFEQDSYLTGISERK